MWNKLKPKTFRERKADIRIIATLHRVEITDELCYEEVPPPPDEPNEVDVTDIILSLGKEDALLIEDDTASSDNLLAELPPDALPQWFQEWEGWHWVEVEESIRRYFGGSDEENH